MAVINLSAEKRDVQGKSASRRLRLAGRVPGIIYGGGVEPQTITLDEQSTYRLLNTESVYASILRVDLNGEKFAAVVKDVQRHPYKPKLVHVDLQRVSDSETIKMHVPLHFINEDSAPAIKTFGGKVAHLVVEVEVQCLPKALPEYIEVDLKDVALGQTLHLSDLKLPEGIQLVELARGADHDQPVVAINKPKGGAAEEAAEGADSDA